MKNKMLLLIIILAAAFLRFYQLGAIPAGLTNDEANIGYDAYSIYHTGRDQWGQFLPLVSFKGFGDYRPSLYTYLVVPVISLFGLTPFAVRFPSALFGVVSIIIFYSILKKLFSAKVGLTGSILFAISPWSIGLSRLGLESNVAPAFLLTGILLFLNFQKKIVYFFLSMLFFAITLYTYSGYTLLTPLIILTLLLFHRKHINKNTKEVIIGIAAFILICLPLFIQNDAAAKIRFSQVNFLQDITSSGIINRLNDQRGECLKTYPSIICQLAVNKATAFGSTIIKNYISHFSVNFLYINGNETQYSALPQRGLLYIFEFFLLVAGFIWIIKERKKEGYLLILLLLLSAIPDTVTGGGHYSRAFVMLPFLLSIETLGFIGILSIFDNQKNPAFKTGYLSISMLVVAGSAVMFFLTYTTYFRVFNSRFSGFGYEELMNYVYTVKNKYARIYISRRLNDTKQYVYYLFYNKYDPLQYQKKKNITLSQVNGGWINIERIDNIYFVDALPNIDPKSQLAKENILYISTPVDFPENVKQKKYFNDLKNDALFEAVSLQDYLEAKSKLQ